MGLETKRHMHRSARRRGTAYVLVLSVTTLLVVMGIGGSMAARVAVEQSDLETEQALTRLAAMCMLDVTHKRLDGRMDWRNTVGNDLWSYRELYGRTKVYVKFIDEIDGSINGDYTQPFRVYAMSTLNKTVRIYSIEFVPDADGTLTRNARTLRQETVD